MLKGKNKVRTVKYMLYYATKNYVKMANNKL